MLQGAMVGVALLYLTVGCSSEDSQASTADPRFGPSGRPKNPDAATDTRVAVIWIETGVCTGCAEALLDTTDPTPEALLAAVRLEFQETLMDMSGHLAMDRLAQVQRENAGKYVLVVDGGIPTGAYAALTTLGVDGAGKEWTAEELVQSLATQAALVVALGTCASWGGIPASGTNKYGYSALEKVAGKSVVRIPGCPPNTGWITGTLVAALAGQPLEMDDRGRAKAFYGRTIHEQCPRRPMFDADQFAEAPGDPTLCLFNVGCKGPVTLADCPVRGWNGNHSCLGVNHPCIGCASPGFPDPTNDNQ